MHSLAGMSEACAFAGRHARSPASTLAPLSQAAPTRSGLRVRRACGSTPRIAAAVRARGRCCLRRAARPVMWVLPSRVRLRLGSARGSASCTMRTPVRVSPPVLFGVRGAVLDFGAHGARLCSLEPHAISALVSRRGGHVSPSGRHGVMPPYTVGAHPDLRTTLVQSIKVQGRRCSKREHR